MRVGLMTMGKSEWIAGVQYLHSLLAGNALLPASRQAEYRIFLDFAEQRVSDYAAVRPHAAGLHLTDFSRQPTWRHKLRRAAVALARQRRWPGLPLDDLTAALRQRRSEVLFTGTDFREDCPLPQICWIPDFQHWHRPEFFSAVERQFRDDRFAQIMARGARVIVGNRCSYDDAIHRYPQAREKLVLLPFTMDLGPDWRSGDPARVVAKYALPEKFLLFPAQFWKHKNHALLFQAIRLLCERGLDDVVLVCTGLPRDYRFPHHPGELRDFVARHRLGKNVRILGLLPRADQVQLLRAAAAIVQPSLFEGWSALLEECRSLGKTVFASDIPMHREQLSERMHLFDPDSAEALADLLARHWPSLRLGPEPAIEATAAAAHQNRLRDFAGHFAELCREVVMCPDGTAAVGRMDYRP